MNLPITSRMQAPRPSRSRSTSIHSESGRGIPSQIRRSLAAIAVLALSFLPSIQAAPFTPGNLVIYRVGSGTGALANTGSPVFLDEFTPAGTLVQSLPMPTAASGANRRLVASGVATAEGQLTRSADGRFLVVTGYDASIPYVSALSGTAANTVFRSIGRVGQNGTVDTSTYLQDFADGGGPRSATSADGSSFWMTGSTGGVRYAPFGATTTSTQLTTTASNLRHLGISNGQLFTSMGSGATPRIASIGSGLPTSGTQTVTGLPGFPASGSPYGFFLADLSPAVAGNDTLYVADEVTGLRKFSLVAGTWSDNGTIGGDADDYRGLTARVSGNSVILFATRLGGSTATGGGQLVSLTDTSGYNGAFTGTPTTLATAAGNTAFRGIAQAPYFLPDLTVDLSAPATAAVGVPFDYTITARNIGNNPATNIGLGFVLPSGLTLNSLTPTGGFFGVGGPGPVIFFTGGSLNAGSSATLTVNVTAAAAGTFIAPAESAYIDQDATINESIETNNGSPQVVSTVVGNPATPPVVTAQPASQTITSGSTATLSVTATGTGPLIYQWYQGISGNASTPVGTNSASFTTPALTSTASYWVKVSNAANPAGVNSNTATVTTESPASDFTWTSNGSAITITGYTGPGGAVVIPVTINGLPVTTIGFIAFFNSATITSITLPSSITDIGSQAFSDCSSLLAITVDAGNPAYSSLDGVLFNKDRTTLLQYPGGKSGAYPMPAGVITIVGNAFQSCAGLSGITLPDGLVSIGTSAFYGCTGLVSITIPASTINVGDGAFSRCTGLLAFMVAGSNVAYSSADGVLFNKDQTALIAFPGGRAGSYNIPTGVTTIGNFAFGGSTSLTTVNVPAGVTSIGYAAFDGCSGLNSVIISAIAISIGDRAFSECTGLTNIIMPAGVSQIGTGAFFGCNQLVSVIFAGSAPTMGANVFENTAFGFKVYYFTGSTGFTSPNWQGYPAVAIASDPSILTQPASATLSGSGTVTFNVEAIGTGPLTYQWYQGQSGNTLSPVPGATSATFTTPTLTASTSYWVRASNAPGTADSGTAIITVGVPPATNANLNNLIPSDGTLSPAFDPATTIYSAKVASGVSGIRVTPSLAAAGATVRVNGLAVISGTASAPVGLNVGNNVITTVVTAGDGVTTRNYTVTITRAAPVLVTTNPAVVIDSTAVVLKGTVNPNGVATVFFEYGTTTAYGDRTDGKEISGTTAGEVQTDLAGLTGNMTYHCRAVAVSAEGTFYGGDVSFTTTPDAPVAATGDPAAVTGSSATLVGAVDTSGLATEVNFEYGLTPLYGQITPVQILPAGAGLVDVVAPNSGLIPNATYHYRIVARNLAGVAYGDDVVFQVRVGSGVPNVSPTAKPAVTTEGVAGVGTHSATLLGSVNPNAGTTVVRFEYGPTTSYGRTTPNQGVGNGTTFAAVSLTAEGLLPGTPVHYRLVASNSLGTTLGADAVFTTQFPSPAATTGDALMLSTTRVKVSGSVRARSASAAVFFDYGTDGVTFPNSVAATPGTVSGDNNVPVSAEISNLAQGTTYHYRVRATGPGGTGTGEVRVFPVSTLSGLIQRFPDGVIPADRQGILNVTLSPGGIGGGWRFAGDTSWRLSGVPATGLTNGDRVVEFRPVPGHLQPASETVSIVSGPVPTALDRVYTTSGSTGSGSLLVILKPDSLAADTVPVANRAQWRLFGETDAQWKDSGTTVGGLIPGNHVIESKEVADRAIPPQVTATVANGQTTATTITYYLKDPITGTPPSALTFQTVSESNDRPYAFVGQIRSDVGSSSGFVVRPQVVVTAGHVVFDDGFLASAPGLQWLFQRDRGVHEPQPQIPRGYYLMTGYAAQRALEQTPGSSSPQSQNLDAASLYFSEPAGRGGFSGYLASDSTSNEFVLSSASKTLVGYPVDGIPANNRDRMHATPLANVQFSQSFGRTYITPDIRSVGGNSGGPLCIQYQNGNFYPAAIYLGGSGQTVVRAIDSDVVELIGFAEASGANGGGGNGGSVTPVITSPVATPTLGALQVMIEPPAARAAGAGWRIRSQTPYQPGGSRENNLSPNTYTVEFAAVDRFVPPARQSVVVKGGELSTITFTYEAIIYPPAITSADSVTGIRGQALSYQITATNSPDTFSLRGTLPTGMTFSAATGLIAGTPQEAGNFLVTVGVSNSGGADTRTVAIASLPLLAPQAVTVPFFQPMSYQIASSEGGDGVTYTAENLPQGLALDPSTGRISGTPVVSGTFVVPVSVTIRSATAAAVLTLNITGAPPVITLQPVASRTIAYGGSTTLTVEASGQPAPVFQWYQGASGITTNPVLDATSASFTSPALTADTSYWVRASSISGSADSTTSAISLLPSSNANLGNLVLSAGSLSPAFNAGISAYSASVANAVQSLTVTLTPEAGQSVVTLNSIPVAQGVPGGPIALAVGSNVVTAVVTAGDGITQKTYVVTVTRAAPPSAVTGVATNLADNSATLNGTVTPNGPATVVFQYGLTAAYGYSTPPQIVSGTSPIGIQTILRGVPGNTDFHFRIAVTSASGTVFGDDASFTTAPDEPAVATGNPVAVATTTATLVGAVDPNGLATVVFFEIGLTTAYGTTTPSTNIPPGTDVVDVFYTKADLDPNATYHYRLVATNATGTTYGDDVIFNAALGGGGSGSGIPTSAPTAVTGGAIGITAASGFLQGTVNPKNGTTFVQFEYGLTNAYGSSTARKGVGNGNDPALVTQEAAGLLPGTLYHYRVVASNSRGSTFGLDSTFTTRPSPPVATTGGALALTNASARIYGSVRARNASTEVFFDYGTDGVTFPDTKAVVGTVGGDAETPVSVDLTGLNEKTIYYYRVRAVNSGGSSEGLTVSMRLGALLGYTQQFSREVPPGDREGQVLVSLVPAGLGGWRFVGEQQWRSSGVTVSGLTTGEREIDFRPLRGYIQPRRETVSVVSGEPTVLLERFYYESAAAGTGSLSVLLEPASLSALSVPSENRARWRLMADADTAWRNSGEVIHGLMPGSYLVEFTAVAGWNPPPASTIVVAQAVEPSTATVTYFPASAPALNPPAVVPFDTVSQSRNLPYAHVGQIRSNSGSYSGFVVKSRVVATAAQTVFNEVTLATATGIQWLLQRDKGAYEPKPQTPRGFYVFQGYAAQRMTEATPGSFSLQSQNLNVAALYFSEDAGRGGFSGFLATDDENEFLQSPALKILAGYPVNGISTVNRGRMHATPPAADALALAFDRTYTTPAIRGLGGMTGGPLCIRRDGGAYYPAGIYLGGADQSFVRAIDGGMIDLFARAELSGNGGNNQTGGGITHSSFTSFGGSDVPGVLKVTILPAAANTAGAGWRLKPETSYRQSEAQQTNLKPANYILQLKSVSGFQTPAEETVDIVGSGVTEITYTYLKDILPPTITSAANVTGTRGKPLTYQIEATRSPDSFALAGTLPAGLVFNSDSGAISGTLKQAGVFAVTIKASNAGGSDRTGLTITARPSLLNQNQSAPLGQPMGFQITSSESGDGVAYSATGLPPGVALSSSGGLITGSPSKAGVFASSVSVTKGGATASATFTLTVTATPLDVWRFAKLGTTSNTGNAADNADPDGDGQTNIDEYAAGTRPDLATDVFKILTASKSPNSFAVTAPGKASRTYWLERRQSLAAGPWISVSSAGPLAADGAVELTDSAPPATTGFYRVRVSSP